MPQRKVRAYFDNRTGDYSVYKCFELTNLDRYNLAEFINRHGNNNKKVEKFIVRNWNIYITNGTLDPYQYQPKKKYSEQKYPLGSKILKRIKSDFNCPACKKTHPLGEGMSRDTIFKWRKQAEKQAANMGDGNGLDYKEVDWSNAIALTNAGIDFHYRNDLKRIFDEVLIECRSGNESPYDFLDHMDLRYLQFFLQYHGGPNITTYDLLCLMDMQKSYDEIGTSEQQQAFEDWLMFRPWENDEKLEKYRAAINNGGVAPLKNDKGEEIPVMLHPQFIRPTSCMQFNLPSQIIDYFIGEHLNRYYPTRDVDTIGIDPWDAFTVTRSLDLDSAGDVRIEWRVENRIDENESWTIITDETL